MKNIVFKIQQTLSIYLLIFALKIQAYDLCALVMWLNIKKIKNINVNYKNTNLKKVLVFPKSGGNEDLFQAFKNKKNNNIIFFLYTKKIFKRYPFTLF